MWGVRVQVRWGCSEVAGHHARPRSASDGQHRPPRPGPTVRIGIASLPYAAPVMAQPASAEARTPSSAPEGAGSVEADPHPGPLRVFGSRQFVRLWLAQVVSAFGDWLGFVAIVAVAARVGGSSPEAGISVVMIARLVPGFFLAPVAGVLVDRVDRKVVMVGCDLARAAVLVSVPFIDALWQLVMASLLLEIGTLLWSPAKEASVPNIVPASHLTNANSLSLVAAYGTFPVASLVFAALAKVAEWLGRYDTLDFLRLNQPALAIYVDVVTFLASALLISTIAVTRHGRPALEAGPEAGPGDGVRDGRMGGIGQTFDELAEGWRFMRSDTRVRAIMLALGTGLVGGGMLVPLGPVFSREVLGGGSAGYGLLLTALGSGVALGVVTVSAVQGHLGKERVFTWAVLGAGAALLLGASTASLTPALVGVGSLGVCAGAVYVLGFTILHESVVDELRGRIFASLYTLVRLCLLASFAIGPLLSNRLDRLSNRLVDGEIAIGRVLVPLPGVRLTLWLAGLIILGAGVLALVSLRALSPGRADAVTDAGAP